MKKFLRHLVLFALLFFIVDKAAYFILKKISKQQSDTKLEKVIAGGMENELVILGSSRGIGNIDTQQLAKETSLTSYNLSFRGGDIIFQKFILESYLKFNKAPEKLLLIIDNPYTFEEGGSLNFRYDRLYPLANDAYINNQLINQGKHSLASKYLYMLRLHGNQLKFKNGKEYEHRQVDEFGSQLLVGQSSFFNKNHTLDQGGYRLKEAKEKIKAFRDIVQMCLAYNIELHYIFPPNYNDFNKTFYNRFLTEIDPEAKIYIYDKNDSRYNDETFYFDASHLNIKGARIFTRELARYVKDTF